MDVALALFRYFPFGGMQRDMLATARLCQDRGHAVRIICHTWQGERPTDLEVLVLPTKGSSNHTRARCFGDAFGEWLRAHRPDVVLGFDKMPGLDFYFAADPCFVARTADRPTPYRWTPRYRTFRKLEGDVFGQASSTRILLLGERERAPYRDAWRTRDDRFEVLPPGIARDRRAGPDANAAQLRQHGRAELGLDDNHCLVLLLAANLQLKGLDRAMRAIASLPEKTRLRTHLLAVGQQPPPALRRLAYKLGIAQQVTMQPGRDDIPMVLQAADLLVHPARRDTTGTVLLEAVAAGLPVICSAACGFAEHIRSANCGLVLAEPFVQQTLDDALEQLLARPLDPERAAALAYAEANDLHGMHEAIVAHLEAFAAARR